jgi:hypothetical protein
MEILNDSKNYEVFNLGIIGAALMKNSDFPYWGT